MKNHSNTKSLTIDEARAIALAAMREPHPGGRRDAPLVTRAFLIPGYDTESDPPRRARGRLAREVFRGTVVADKTDDTVVVKVERRHAYLAKKNAILPLRIKVYDESTDYRAGDQVLVAKVRNRLKQWIIVGKKAHRDLNDDRRRA
ncbi:30S ribosomal protein S17 [Mesorhizobium opportunistum]|uniref:30S ribosomal protein S17 n=1 Tax=Mesorhizobium opportunistum TaxID=593909 RepID=A0ABV1YGH9_9HYPH|nr:30S ribosomal protein S17 [Mesorhizobium sp.]TIN97078.1 MAG: 30S ribosomal protein S17 [Mesorhizobium sp.]TJV00025.1 MAG: 30S ribosomal protein S17 [Mesorhizobium sp.]TJV16947.1 MAG: 30S ribosomal protein S17 [Mesorhizobium sp.]